MGEYGGGGDPGEMGAGSLRESREKRARETGYPRGREPGGNIAQYFAIGKAHRGWNRYGMGREPEVHGFVIGKFTALRPPPPPPHPASAQGKVNI